MINCHKVTQLTVIEGERPLSLWERVGLRIHRVICAPCRAYHRQLIAMRAAARTMSAAVEQTTDAGPAGSAGVEAGAAMSSDARDRIRQRLQQARGD